MTPDSGIAWGLDVYDAEDHANEALSMTRRAGAAAPPPADTPMLHASVADALLQLQYITWNFGDSVCFEAMIAASDRLGDERWARFAHGWGRAWATRSQPFVRLDCTAPGRALVELSVRYNDSQLLDACTALADYLMTRPTLSGVFETWESSPLLAPYSKVKLSKHEEQLLASPPPGVFVDCLHFDPPFLSALGVALRSEKYMRAGVEQALGYVTLLQTDDGPFDHFVLRGEPESFGPGWGRGQGWAILGLIEVVESIDHFGGFETEREVLVESARRLLHAMLRLQRDDGHWFAVVTDPNSGDEFSTAGFMAWAIASALRLGIIDGQAMENCMARARAAILSSLDNDGLLREVSAAVYASTEPSHYGMVPRGYVVPWGQGPALLALVAL